MNFRRLPFQFTAVNPSERQAEIRKQFGLSKPSNMILDLGNSRNMETGFKEPNSATSSPRLQHRVPVFVEDPDPCVSEKLRSNNVDNGKKPNVRVIPIEYEGDRKPVRQRNFSGPAGIQQNSVQDRLVEKDIKPVMHTTSNMTLPNRKRMPSGETKPCVYNIPIQIEKRESSSEPLKKPNLNPSPKDSKMNGCKVTKTSSEEKLQKSEEKIPETVFKLQLKKVDDVLNDLKSYASGVESFSGTANDKQYRYLDEMLTRLMLRLDDIETMGNSEVRNARKAAIKKVQSYIDLLETKINSDSEEKAEAAISVDAKDFSGDIKEDKLETEKDMTESSTEYVELKEVPEVEMTEATVTEPQEMKESNKMTSNEAEEVPEVEMVESYATDSEKMNYCDKIDLDQQGNSFSPKDVLADSNLNVAEMEDRTESCKNTDDNLEILNSTERNESEPEIKMASKNYFEPTESEDKNSQETNTITELKSSSLETSADVDMVESTEKFQDSTNEPCVQNFNGDCDIEMSDSSLQSVKNSGTKVDSSVIIPENKSHSDIKESPKEILDEDSRVTASNQNAELFRSEELEREECKLTDLISENNA